MKVALKIFDVECSYGATKVLDGLSFTIERGSFTGILGPNGSGKSTLMRCISRVLKPSKGAVLLDEENLFGLDLKDVARKMAVVTQETAVDFSFTVAEVVMMGRSPYLGRFQSEGEKDFEIARKVMELTNTLILADRSITTLSGGERQRVIIAKALAQDTEIILLDEPTSHLDINHQVEILGLLRRLNRENGLTVVTVFHDLNLASQYCDSVILMRDGRIFTIGRPDESLTAANIKDVFGASVLVGKHPVTGRPAVMILSREPRRSAKTGSIHVVCGGGAGADILRLLASHGYSVSAGVLNTGDIDWETAKLLELRLAEEAPFSLISDQSHEENLELIKGADACVMAGIPFGHGNLKNLEAVCLAWEWGKPVLLIEEQQIEERDFTGGRASLIYEELKKKGAVVLQGTAGIQHALAELLHD